MFLQQPLPRCDNLLLFYFFTILIPTTNFLSALSSLGCQNSVSLIFYIITFLQLVSFTFVCSFSVQNMLSNTVSAIDSWMKEMVKEINSLAGIKLFQYLSRGAGKGWLNTERA